MQKTCAGGIVSMRRPLPTAYLERGINGSGRSGVATVRFLYKV